MSAEQRLVDELRAADRSARRAGPPPDVDARIRAALHRAALARAAPPRAALPRAALPRAAEPRRPSAGRALAFGLAASAVAAAALFVLLPRAEDPGALDPGAVGPGVVVPDRAQPGVAAGADPTCTPPGPGREAELPAACAVRVSDLGVLLETAGPARVERRGDDLIVLAGTVTFDVDRRQPPEAPFWVYAGGARIEVLGTRFTVRRGPAPGSVHLHHGRIRLYREGVPPVLMIPGDRLALAVVEETAGPGGLGATKGPDAPHLDVHASGAARRAPAEAASPRPSPMGGNDDVEVEEVTAPAPPSPAAAATILAEAAERRTLGDYEGALERVEALLDRSDLDVRERQVALVERVSLLRRLDAAADRRCAALGELAAFAQTGVHVERASRERAALGCPSPDDDASAP